MKLKANGLEEGRIVTRELSVPRSLALCRHALLRKANPWPGRLPTFRKRNHNTQHFGFLHEE